MLSRFYRWSMLAVLAAFVSSCASSSSSTTEPVDDWLIPSDQVISGGVPRDGIPSLSNPKKVSAAEATYLPDEALVLGFVFNGQAVAYPYPILDWHEIVNESFNGQNVTISYCPLTGTGIVFDGDGVSGRKLTFGVSGLLFNNNLIMFDRETNSHWPQMLRMSAQGELKGTPLPMMEAIETSWGAWKKIFPGTQVLSDDTGFGRPYNRPGSAYPGYANLFAPPLFPIAVRDNRQPPKAKVHGLFIGEKTKAYSLISFQGSGLLNDVFENVPLLVVGDNRVPWILSFKRTVDGQVLTFKFAPDGGDTFPFTLVDEETGSKWDVLGRGIEGPLAGKQLERPASYTAYWFGWSVFFPGTELYAPDES
jgi:hypothetical protein